MVLGLKFGGGGFTGFFFFPRVLTFSRFLREHLCFPGTPGFARKTEAPPLRKISPVIPQNLHARRVFVFFTFV